MPANDDTLRTPSLSLRAAILCVHALLTAACVGFGLAWNAGRIELSAGELIHGTSLALLVLFAWSLASWILLTGSWFDPYSFFLIAASLFNAGQAFLEVFGLNRHGMLQNLFTEETIRDTLMLVFLGLAGLHLGALLSVSGPRPMPTSNGAATSTIGPRDVRLAGWLLFLVSAPPTVIVMRAAIERVLEGGYFSLYQAELGTGVQGLPQILSGFLVPAVLLILAGSKGSYGNIAAAAAILFAYSGCQLFLGFRYYAIMPIVAYLWVWHMVIRPVPKSVVLGMGVFLIGVVLPLVGLTRDTRGYSRLSLDFLTEAYTSMDSPHVAVLHEMGGTARTVAHTLELVPDARPHDQGMTYVYAAGTVGPNLYWDVHPSVAAGKPSSWLIWAVDPETAAQGGGLAYSFIAEAYLNFGWIGTPLVTGLLGFLYARFVLAAMRDHQAVALVAMVACFAAAFTFYARDDSHVVFRSLIWYSLGPYGLAYTIAVLRRGAQRTPALEASP